MKNTLDLLKQEFESSSSETPQFKRFVKEFKKDFNALLKKLGSTDIRIYNGHFYISGFFTNQNKVWYFNLGDVRWHKSMYIRRSRDYKDYSGGVNRDISLDNADTLTKEIEYELKG